MTNNYELWNEYDFFFSTVTSQQFLEKCYDKRQYKNAKSLSFSNTYRFIYYLEHGKSFIQTAMTSPMSIKPMLLFYGYIHLLKACLVVVDPMYPENTQVLAHGVTSRKKKRQHYDFLSDEVKIQKNGLFTHIGSQIFSYTFAEGEKFIMKNLLYSLPELQKLVRRIENKNILIPLKHVQELTYTLPIEILDFYHMQFDRFSSYIQENISREIILQKQNNTSLALIFSNNNFLNPLRSHQLLRFHITEKSYHLPYLIEKDKPMNEILQYYLLLYNLSMLSRYETEWWGELLHNYTNTDFPFIIQFTEIALKKIPYMILQLLNSF